MLPIFQECKMYTQHQERLSDEHIFSNAFQNALHTGSNYELLLQLEYLYNSEIEEMIKQRDKQVQEMDFRLDENILLSVTPLVLFKSL